MKHIIALLSVLPSMVQAGPVWSRPQQIKSAMVLIELLDKKTEAPVFSALSKYNIDDQGQASLFQNGAETIMKNNPIQDLLYKYNVAGSLTGISDGKANLEHEITKTKKDENPIMIQAKKSLVCSLRRNAMTRSQEEIETPDQHHFLLRIDIYTGFNTWNT